MYIYIIYICTIGIYVLYVYMCIYCFVLLRTPAQAPSSFPKSQRFLGSSKPVRHALDSEICNTFGCSMRNKVRHAAR